MDIVTNRPRRLVRKLFAGPLVIAAAFAVSAMSSTPPSEATADIVNVKNQTIGKAIFTQTSQGVKIRIDATNLPAGTVAFHIHENGTCDAANGFKGAGSHFNPTGAQHGRNTPDGAHAGDMPNQTVSTDGTLHTEVLNSSISMDFGKPSNILDTNGSAIVLHAKPDDYTSQPAGDSGDRIACGVITTTR